MFGESLGGSYTSMDRVYHTTTVPAKMAGQNVMESLKKVLSFGAQRKTKLDPLLEKTSDTVEIINRQSKTSTTSTENGSSQKMPTMIAEEAALLGTMPSDSMDDIELKNIQLQFPSSRRLSGDGGCTEVRVRTDRGDLLVAMQGDRTKPAIITYHDLGLNYVSSFQAFFNFVDMRALLENFCVYHVTAPGQEEGAPTMPEDYVYPTMDELANQINYVIGHFGIKSFIGFGVGAGANILARYAISHPQKVGGLVLINCTSTQAGWIEWGYQKMNSRHLRSRGMTQAVLDYLMWHHFGRNTAERNHDLVQVYRMYFSRHVNPTNLSMLIDSYVRRSDLGISRDGTTLKVPVLNITGALSPHVDDTVTFNGRLDPANSTWMKISDCGMVLEEQPGKISEAFRLFLQGEGYVETMGPWSGDAVAFSREVGAKLRSVSGDPLSKEHFVQRISLAIQRGNAASVLVAPLSPTKMSAYRRLSEEAALCARPRPRPCRLQSPVIRITENPISEAIVC